MLNLFEVSLFFFKKILILHVTLKFFVELEIPLIKVYFQMGDIYMLIYVREGKRDINDIS